MGLLFFLFVVLIVLSAFFSASETALFSLSQVDLHQFRQSSSKGERRVVECLNEPRKLLVTILFGNELANVAISIVGASLISRIFPFGVYAQTFIAVVVVTPLLLVLGEILPKNVALTLARKMAPSIAPPLQAFQWMIRPIQFFLSGIADRMIRLFGGEPEASEPMIMEQEYRHLIDLGRERGVIVEEEREVLHKVFEFTDKVVSQIMTPVEHLFMLHVDMPYEQMLEEIRATHFSRIPIYENTPGNIIGILHVLDLFAFDRKRKEGGQDIRTMLRKPIFVKPDEPIERLLRNFQEHRVHMAIVSDKAQGVAGVATMHDILQALFGEMEES